MSTENNSDEIPGDVVSENEPESDDLSEESKPTAISIKELSKLWELEKQTVSEYDVRQIDALGEIFDPIFMKQYQLLLILI